MAGKVVFVSAERGVQFSLCSVFTIIAYAILIFGVILSAIALIAVAEHQDAIFDNANKVGTFFSTAINNGQSLTGFVNNCLQRAYVAWNVFWTFVLAVAHRIANANDADFFNQYSRFIVVDVICDFIAPTFEIIINLLVMIGFFLLKIVVVFLQLLVSLGKGNFSAFDIMLQTIFDVLLNIMDPDHCIHPVTGPDGFPGNILHCMNCGIPVHVMNTNDNTKTNALFVCVCGGDINGDILTILEGCIHLQDIISYFDAFVDFMKTVGDAFVSLGEDLKKVTVIWDYVQSVYNSIVGAYDSVRHAICKIPFVCKILHIRSLTDGTDDAYVCSYDTNNPSAPPVCFYESVFRMSQKNITFTEEIKAVQDAMAQYIPPTHLQLGHRIRAWGDRTKQTFLDRHAAYQAGVANRTIEPRESYFAKDSVLREVLIGTHVFVKHFTQAMASGIPTDINVFKKELYDRDFRPHLFRRTLRNSMRSMGLTPLDFETPIEQMRAERAEPAPTKILFNISTYALSYSFNGATNLSNLINSIFQILLSVSSTLIPVVLQEMVAVVQDIFPIPIQVFPVFNILGPINDIFTPLFNDGFSQLIPVSLFETAFSNLSTAFDDVMSSQIGLVVAQYVLTFPFMIMQNANNRPPTHPDLHNISEMLTTIINCNPSKACVAPEPNDLAPCNCLNGTVITGNIGVCATTGVKYCWPLMMLQGQTPATTIDLNISLKGSDYGYVTKHIIYPFTDPWSSIKNCLSTFWNGTLPFVLTTLMWGLYVPFFTVPLNYTVGWCPCCGWLTRKLMFASFIGSAGSFVFRYTAQPINNYCQFRSVFYCGWYRHFFRPDQTTPGQWVLFFANTSTNTFGFILAVLIAIVVALFIIIFSMSIFYIIKSIVSLVVWAVTFNMAQMDKDEMDAAAQRELFIVN